MPSETKNIPNINWRRCGIDRCESLWSVTHKLVYLNLLSARQTWNFLFGKSWQSGQIMSLWPSASNGIREQARLALDLTEWESDTMVVTGFSPLFGRKGTDIAAISSVSLRYCPECIKKGFHTALYQCLWIERCPIHRSILLNVCPKCLRPIPYAFFADLLNNPFGCTNCHHVLWPGRDNDEWYDPLDEHQKQVICAYRNAAATIQINTMHLHQHNLIPEFWRLFSKKRNSVKSYSRVLRTWYDYYGLDGVEKGSLVGQEGHVTTVYCRIIQLIPCPLNKLIFTRKMRVTDFICQVAIRYWEESLLRDIRQIFCSIRRYIEKHALRPYAKYIRTIRQQPKYIGFEWFECDDWLFNRSLCKGVRAFLLWQALWERNLFSDWRAYRSYNRLNLSGMAGSPALGDLIRKHSQDTQISKRIFAQGILETFFHIWDMPIAKKPGDRSLNESLSEAWPYIVSNEYRHGDSKTHRISFVRDSNSTLKKIGAKSALS